MAVIGTFTKTETGWRGKLQSLVIRGTELHVEKIDAKSERAPDYRVLRDDVEVGAGWTKEAHNGGTYVALRLDDPLFPAPLFAKLVFRQNGEAVLLWNRPKEKEPE
jgi:uncharacterized protein (DUF736 family)